MVKAKLSALSGDGFGMQSGRDWLVIAPHPDDETLGCGGALLRALSLGVHVHWVIMTEIPVNEQVGEVTHEIRTKEIREVSDAYGFSSVTELKFPTLRLDIEPRHVLVRSIGSVLDKVQPSTVLIPWYGDAHSDHRVTFEAVQACLKAFRAPWVRRVLAYEVLSETNVSLDRIGRFFDPSEFICIDGFVERKIEIMNLYHGQMERHPFPRNPEAIRALALLRGVQSYRNYAEGFVPLFSVT